MSRGEWLRAICSPEWADVKPNLEEHGNPNSPLIRTLIDDLAYRRMYAVYLIAKHAEPSSLLLEALRSLGHRDVANEIMESVVIASENL